MFGTDLAFQQRDLALEISFHSKIITKGSPPKESYFFFLHALEQEAIMIRSAVDCQKMAEETLVTSTTQCTLGTIQDGGQEFAKQCFSLHISRDRTKELLHQLRIRVEKKLI